jgi:hypothetical protein
VNFQVSRTQFRQVLKFPLFEICSMLKQISGLEKGLNSSVEFPVINGFSVQDMLFYLKSYYEENFPKKLKPCPITNDFVTDLNVSAYIKHDFEKSLPSGNYKYVHRIFNDEDANIFTKIVFESFKTNTKKFF